MGISHSHKKQEETLSPQALYQTSIDDKAWLGVTEENLFNESFTHEKYYMIHSRRGDSESGQGLERQEKGRPRKEKEDLVCHTEHLVGIVEEEPREQHAALVTKLVGSLSSTKKTLYYDSILQKRISILKRIHLAMSRERAREKLLITSSTGYLSKQTKIPVSAVNRMTVRLLITMLQSQKDSHTSQATLATLNEMLKGAELLSLQEEPEDCLLAFHRWLLNVSSEEGAFSPEVKNSSMESLLTLSLNTGSLSSILSAIHVLILHFTKFREKDQTLFSSLQMVPLLRQLADWQVDLLLSPLSKDRLFGSWTILWNESMENNSVSFMSAPASNIATCAAGGSYLYIHDSCGLVKVGTGFLTERQEFSTTQGKVYARNSFWKLDEKGWIACVQDRLYYRSVSIEPATLVVFNATSLEEEGRIFQDGTGSISSADNTTLAFGPEQQGNFSPLVSDGRYLYIITHHQPKKYQPSKFYVDIYDPCLRMQHIRRVKLCFAETRKNVAMAPVLNPKILESGLFYTNGHYLMAIIPPPLATDYNYDSKTYLCRSFNLRDGRLVGNFSIDNHSAGSAPCYDSVNNVIWIYSGSGAEVARYINEGLGPKHKFPNSLSAAAPVVTLPEDSQPMESTEVVLAILGILDRLSQESMPSPSESNLGSPCYSSHKLKEPFCVEVKAKTFSLLLSTLQLCKNYSYAVENSMDSVRFSQVALHCMRILKVNLFRLASSSVKVSRALLQESQSVLWNIRDLLLEIVNLDTSKQSEDTAFASKLIQEEACQVFTVGMDLFYLTSLGQAQFLLGLFSSKASEGQRALLHALLNLFSNHTNASNLVLPPESVDSDMFDHREELTPIITNLLREAESSMPHQPDDFYAATFLSSSPALRLLMAIQKDLLLRASQTVTGVTIRALVAYSKLIFQKCIDLIDTSLSTDTQPLNKSLLEIRLSVTAALLPTLVHSLFLFSSQIWLAKELLPSIIELIKLIDRVNQKLPSIPTTKLQHLQKKNEFIAGPSRIAESQHPYAGGLSRQVVNIPGAVFLALVFDERCSTAGQSDYLQLYQDQQCSQPIGDIYLGDRSRWPKRRVLVPGDTVVFNFHAEVTDAEWGFRCVVIGHMPNSDQESIPWSAHLQKTLCCLGGQFSALLISGNELTDAETVHHTLLKFDFLRKGIHEDMVPTVFPVDDGEFLNVSWDDIGRSASDFRDEVQAVAIDSFCQDLLTSCSGSDAILLADWIEQHLIQKRPTDPSIREAQNAVLAVLLKQTGLAMEAMSLTAPLEKKNVVSSKRRKAQQDLLPSTHLIRVWNMILRVKQAIIQQHQEQQLNTSIEAEIDLATRRMSKELTQSLSEARQQAYRRLADKVIEKANFLFSFLPCNSTNPDETSMSVLSFVLHPLPIAEVKKLFRVRRARAFARAFGLQAIQSILRNSTYLSMKHEVLCFLGPALRSSATSKHSWPHHYLDHLEGAGEALESAVTSAFTSVMTDVACILRDDACDASLQLLALDPWVLEFRLTDHWFLHNVDIFHTIHRLISQEETPDDGKYEKKSKEKLSRAAKDLFRLLGAICMEPDDSKETDSRCDALQESFFLLLASQLESAVFEPSGGQESPVISPRNNTAPEINGDIDWFENLTFLYSLSASSVVQNALSRPRFLRLFLSLLQTGESRIQLLTLRLFKRVLPGQHPDYLLVQKGKSFISMFFEMIGSIYFLTTELDHLSHRYPIVKSFVNAVVNHEKAAQIIGDVPGNANSKLALSHPFFPFNDPKFILPTGWEKKGTKGQVTLSEDTRTATFHSSATEDEHIGAIRANVPIPEGLRFFYFEIRIEDEGEDGHVGIGLSPTDQKLRGMPGWYNGSYGYHGDDGARFSYLLEGKGETYGSTFSKNDVIGCGWNIKEGTIFFTKNGEDLGTAFKNVYGRFHPTVGVNSRNACILVNFGQMPFLFDLSQIIQSTRNETNERSGAKGHGAVSFASESIMLIRHLLKSQSWKPSLLKFMTSSLATIPSLLKNLLNPKPLAPAFSASIFSFNIDYSSVCHLIATLAIIGGHSEGLRVGGRVEVELAGVFEKGVVIDYVPKSPTAVVVLDSQEGKRVPCVRNVVSLRAIPEVPVDLSLVSFPHNILANITLFLRPSPSTSDQFDLVSLELYYQLKMQVMKIVNIWFQNPSTVSFFTEKELVPVLIELSLEPVDEEHPKIPILEKRALLLKEHLFEVGATAIVTENALKEFEQDKDEPEEGRLKKRRAEKMEDVLFLAKKSSVDAPRVLEPGELEEPEEDEIAEGDDEAIKGKPVKWKEIKHGMALMVSRRENVSRGKSDWIATMDKTIGKVGLVKALDRKTKQVLLNLYESETASSYEWWYSYRVLVYPEGISTDPFQRLGSASTEELLGMMTATYRSLVVLYCRQAIITLLGNMPSNLVSISGLGGAQNLVNMLKLTVIDVSSPLVREKYAGSQRGIAKPEIRKQLAKLIALLRQEAVSKILPREHNKDSSVQWKKHPMPMELSPQKAGFLTKQGKLLKGWKRQWFVLQGNYLSYFKSPQSADPLGVIDLQDMLRAESVHLPKGNKLKKEFCFRLATTRRMFLFKSLSRKDKDEWVALLEAAKQISTPQNPSSAVTRLPDSSLAWVLTRECVRHFNNTADEGVSVIVEESPHPYQSQTRIKKLVRIEGCEKILVLFDRSCHIHKTDTLKFFRDIQMTEALGTFTGRGLSDFHPILIEDDHFWLVFSSESNSKKWGYRIFVTPLLMKQNDSTILNKASFDFGYCLADWILNLVPVWVKPFYCEQVFNGLTSHLQDDSFNMPHTLDRRVKVIGCLTRLLTRYREFPPESPPDLPRLAHMKQEMFDLFHREHEDGERLHSLYLQRLIELMIRVELAEAWQRKEGLIQIEEETKQETKEMKTIDTPEREKLKRSQSKEASKKHVRTPSATRVEVKDKEEKKDSKEEKASTKEKKEERKEKREKVSKKEETKEKRASKETEKSFKREKKDPHSEKDNSWFDNAVRATRVMTQLVRGEGFPHFFIHEACRESQKQVIAEESPHPYPPGVRVTSTVSIPFAQSLVVTFDPRSRTETNADYLMFSRLYVGGDELGLFSGEFPKEPLVIAGNKFIWSFLSDSSGQGYWGFRFQVNPVFSEEVQQDLALRCEKDYQVSTTSADEWSLAADHELVKFINYCSEKFHSTSKEFSVKKAAAELSHCPLLCDIPIEAIEHRTKLLKHFNNMMTTFIPIVDLKNFSEEWSLGFLVCSLRGLLFYDVKVNFLNDVLSRDRSLLSRPVVVLDRQEDALKENCLFNQGFQHLYQVDPTRLRQNTRAFEVKLKTEGAEDIGGPYRESITQFCLDIQSKELGLFIPCPNAKEEVGFNQEKFIPNPSATTKLAQYEFIGRLIGIAIRTKNALDLSLPSIVWKPLVAVRPDRSDLEAIDKRCCQFLDSIRNISKEGVTEETFNDFIFETFTTQSADEKVIELKPGGANSPVTWHNRNEFTSLVEQYRLGELNQQTEAMIRGVASIIPLPLLYIFTWQEIEFRVCGRPGIDLESLEKHTEYLGLSATESHIVHFWAALKSFTPEEQGLFLRFVSGRSRLPPESEFTSPFQIQPFAKSGSDEDSYLPEAQTCFFSLSLPRYSSYEIMREKLLYAINTCKEIDTDFVVADRSFLPDDEEDYSEYEEDSSDSENEDTSDSACVTQ